MRATNIHKCIIFHCSPGISVEIRFTLSRILLLKDNYYKQTKLGHWPLVARSPLPGPARRPAVGGRTKHAGLAMPGCIGLGTVATRLVDDLLRQPALYYIVDCMSLV